MYKKYQLPKVGELYQIQFPTSFFSEEELTEIENGVVMLIKYELDPARRTSYYCEYLIGKEIKHHFVSGLEQFYQHFSLYKE